jgi:hypothetical protein
LEFLQQFSALLSKPLKFSGIEGAQYEAQPFRIGGAAALSLAGYSDEEIQSRGRLRSAVFKFPKISEILKARQRTAALLI